MAQKIFNKIVYCRIAEFFNDAGYSIKFLLLHCRLYRTSVIFYTFSNYSIESRVT